MTLFFLALSVRVLFLYLAPPRPLTIDDALSWDAVAWNFLHGRGFLEADGSPTSNRPPIYPIFLAGIYLVFGRNYFMVKLFQALIGAVSVVALFYLVKNIFDEKLAKVSAYLCTVWPPLVVYTGIIGTETFFTFLATLFFLFLIYGWKTGILKYFISAGFILGLANLTRSTFFWYPVFLILAMLVIKDYKYVLKVLFLFIISVVIVVPWTLRNYRAFGGLLLINTGAGELFWSGTYIPWDGVCIHGRDEHFRRLFNLKNPVDNEKKMFREGVKNIMENPVGFLKLSVKKFFRFWFKPVGQELVSKRYKLLGLLMYVGQVVIFVLFLYGIISAKNKNLFPLLILFIYMGITHNLVAPIPRYRLPIESFMLVFSAQGMFVLLRNAVFIKGGRYG